MERRSRKTSSSAGNEKMERVGDRNGKMERYCSTGQSPQRAVAPTEEHSMLPEDIPSLLYYGHWVIPGGKAGEAWCKPITPSSAAVKERVESYLYCPSVPT
jgi:hypothetical protein